MDLIGESLASVHIHELLELSTLRKLHMPFSNAQRPGKTKQENQEEKCILYVGPEYVVTIINQESEPVSSTNSILLPMQSAKLKGSNLQFTLHDPFI